MKHNYFSFAADGIKMDVFHAFQTNSLESLLTPFIMKSPIWKVRFGLNSIMVVMPCFGDEPVKKQIARKHELHIC